MTTEIAVMNKSAVALAADSAASISTPYGDKVYETVNKMFQMIKNCPVGIMIYNSSELNGIGWEVLIKAYRDSRMGCSFATVNEYLEDFLEYLASSVALPAEYPEMVLRSVADSISADVRKQAHSRIEAESLNADGITSEFAVDVLNETIERINRELSSIEDRPWADQIDPDAFLRQNELLIEGIVDGSFDNLISERPDLRGRIKQLIADILVRSPEAITSYSGVVITGFGNDEYMPRLRELHVYCVLGGVVMYEERQREDISLSNPAAVRSFAQDDMVRGFTDGIQGHFRAKILGFWTEELSNFSDKLKHVFQGKQFTSEQCAVIVAESQSILKESCIEFANAMQHHESQVSREPVIQSLAFLPKDHMAEMAESLVSLTSLKRHVSINESPTVGGEVDVAVISRGDGFVWIKRKHYFDQALNPSWPILHSGTVKEHKREVENER